MLTPDDIQKKMFSLGRKLENTDVGIFVKEVQINYQLIYDKVNDYEKQIKGMEKKLRYYRDVESSLQDALVHAEKVSEQKIAESKAEAKKIEAAAHKKAEDIIADAKSELVYLKSIIKEFEQVYDQYQDKYQDFIEGQLKFIDDSKKFMENEKINVKKFVSNIDVEDYSPETYKKSRKSKMIDDESEYDDFDKSKKYKDESVSKNRYSDENFNERSSLEEDDEYNSGASKQYKTDISNDYEKTEIDRDIDRNIDKDIDKEIDNKEEYSNSEYSDESFEDDEYKNSDYTKSEYEANDFDETEYNKSEFEDNVDNEEITENEDIDTYDENEDVDIDNISDINHNMDNEEIPTDDVEEAEIVPEQMKEEYVDSNSVDDLFTLPEIDMDSLDFSTLNFNSSPTDGGVDYNNAQSGGGVDYNSTQPSTGVDFNSIQSGVDFNGSQPSAGVDFNEKKLNDETIDNRPLSPEGTMDNDNLPEDREPDLSMNANVELKFANDSFFGKKKKVDGKEKVLNSLNLGGSKQEEKEKIRQLENSYAQELLKSNQQVANGPIEPEDADENISSSDRNYGPANFNSENRGLASKPLSQGKQETQQRRSLFSFTNENKL